MGCTFLSTSPKPGDDYVTLLRKLAQALGETWTCADSEWHLVAKILQHYGGTPKPGDSITKLWEKIRIALGDTLCYCGDSEWHAIRRALDQLLAGSFAVGDSKYNLVFKFVSVVSGGTPPPPVVVLDPPTISQTDTNELSISGVYFGTGGAVLHLEQSADGTSGWTEIGAGTAISGDPVVIDITGITNAFFRARTEMDTGDFSPYSVVFEAYRSPTASGNIPNDSMESYVSGVDLEGLNGGENGTNVFTIPWVSDYVDITYGDTGPELTPESFGADMDVWVRADQITGVADGDPLSLWEDKSVNDIFDFVSAGGARPTYNTNVQNGLPGVNFTSVAGVRMAGSFASSGPELSVMIVLRSNALSYVGRRAVHGTANWLIGPYGGYLQVYNNNFLAGYQPDLLTHVVIVTQASSGNLTRIYIDGGPCGLMTTATTFPGTMGLGASLTFGEPTNARIFEVAIFSKILSDVEAYGLSLSMMNKWGI
jgi:hypothetical protein